MHKLTRVLAASLGVALVAAGTVSAAPDARPSLRILDERPLKLRGERFGAEERIKLVVSLGRDQVTRKLRASASGSFTTVFPSVRIDRCGRDLAVTAVGSRGSSASFKVLQPQCLPALRE